MNRPMLAVVALVAPTVSLSEQGRVLRHPWQVVVVM